MSGRTSSGPGDSLSDGPGTLEAVTNGFIDGFRARVRSLVSGTRERDLEAQALFVGAGAFVVTGLVAIGWFWMRSAPIAGTGSVGHFAAVGSAAVAIAAFVLATVMAVRRTGATLGVFEYVAGVALAVAYAAIAALSCALLSDIMARGFVDATVYSLPAALLSAGIAAASAYLVYISVTHLDLSVLAAVLAVFLVEGIVAAMLSADDPHWWKDNLSALGMTGETSADLFNLTVIVAGILVIALAVYTTNPLPRGRGMTMVRTTMAVIGVCLMVVGLVPVDVSFLVHTGFASGMLVVFMWLTVMLGRWLPGLPASFLTLGWIFDAVFALLVVLFAIGYYTLTAVELVAGILVFVWIILFIRNVSAVAADNVSSTSLWARGAPHGGEE